MNHAAARPPPDRAEFLGGLAQAHAYLTQVSAPPQRELFQTLAWFEHLARHGFADGVQVRLAALPGTDGATLLPLAEVDSGLRSLSNYYSSLYGPIGAASRSPEAWRALAQAMRGSGVAAVIDLQPLAADDAWVGALANALRAEGYWVDRYFCFGNWYLPMGSASFAAYFAALPSPLRHSIERGRKRLQRTEGYALTIETGQGLALDAAMVAFDTVYRQSWKAPEPCPDFMPGLMRLAATHGWLRLGVLQVQGQPIAAQVWLVVGGKANIYKLAYVQGFERLSPGSVLTAALMAHVMDQDRVREVDYLTGDDAYKRDWMSHRRERIGLVAFDPRRLRGLWAAARHFGGRWLRGLKKAVS